MYTATLAQIRSFRLRSHHLDTCYAPSGLVRLAGACGFPNSPPGAWESAAFFRAPGCTLPQLEQLLYQEKALLQAWSIRGIPLVFPTADADVFLSALRAREGEPWIYTRGIQLALDFLGMDFAQVWGAVQKVMPQLDGLRLVSKTALDETLAARIRPLLPAEKQELWGQPSMYGHPDRQTVGGAVVSFLLRPAAMEKKVVFGEREGIQPTFTSFRTWLKDVPAAEEPAASPSEMPAENAVGSSLPSSLRQAAAEQELVRRYLHCYGPANPRMLGDWLGCSPVQAKRLWKQVEPELEPVDVAGKKAFLLSSDRDALLSPPEFSRELLLLGGHDPFLDQRDRWVLQDQPARQRQLWRTVSNPGAILFRGEAVGIWTPRKKGTGLEITLSLWKEAPLPTRESAWKPQLERLAGEYAAFRQQELKMLVWKEA